jgi:enoyl-CoA hydratase/carnithine racemase
VVSAGRIQLAKRDHVLEIGFDRAAKRNAFDLAMWNELCLAEAARRLLPDLQPLMKSDDVQEGLRAFVERRPGSFRGQ